MALCCIGFGRIDGEQLALTYKRHDQSTTVRSAQFNQAILGRYIRRPCNNHLSGDAGESGTSPHPFHDLNDYLYSPFSIARIDVVAECSEKRPWAALLELVCRFRIEVALSYKIGERVGQTLWFGKADYRDPDPKRLRGHGCKRSCLRQ